MLHNPSIERKHFSYEDSRPCGYCLDNYRDAAAKISKTCFVQFLIQLFADGVLQQYQELL